MRRRILLAVLVVPVLAACARSGAGGPGGSDSGVRGVVLVGPQCPAEDQNSPCPDEPWVGRVRATSGSDSIDRSTDDRGRFTIRLSPGRWTLVPLVEGRTPPSARPVVVEVQPHAFTHVTLTVDSGIR